MTTVPVEPSGNVLPSPLHSCACLRATLLSSGMDDSLRIEFLPLRPPSNGMPKVLTPLLVTKVLRETKRTDKCDWSANAARSGPACSPERNINFAEFLGC